MRFGLYAVDGKDPKKTRRPRSGVDAFRRIAAGLRDGGER
jgi:hypothetical protein